jgi:phage terminase Nu1 subunit (DNA packaging protein)
MTAEAVNAASMAFALIDLGAELSHHLGSIPARTSRSGNHQVSGKTVLTARCLARADSADPQARAPPHRL